MRRAEDDSEIEDDDEDDDEDIQDWFSKSSHFLQHTSPILTHPNTFFAQYWVVYISSLLFKNFGQFIGSIFISFLHFKLPSFPSITARNVSSNNPRIISSRTTNLWRRHPTNPRLVILNINRRNKILQLAHDKLGHRGVYGTAKTISLRFLVASYFSDIDIMSKPATNVKSEQTNKMHIPITVSAPATLFTKVYLDIMLMPKAQRYRYIIAERDDLSGAAEGRKLKRATARTISQFIFEELICRYGAISEIVTDNGPEVKGATEELLRRHGNSPNPHFALQFASQRSC